MMVIYRPKFSAAVSAMTLALAALANAAPTRPVIVSFGSHNAEPFAFIENERLTGGIIKEIMDQAGKLAGVRISYMHTPRKRMSPLLLSGAVHVVLIANPGWVKSPDQYQWSIPLFDDANCFVVSTANDFPISHIQDLKEKKLGTILGYTYPGLTGRFHELNIIREDVYTLEANFTKLQMGRIDCLIDSQLLVAYHIKKHQAYHTFRVPKKRTNPHQVQAMLSRHLPLSLDRINAVFKQLKESGQIQKILDRYTQNRESTGNGN